MSKMKSLLDTFNPNPYRLRPIKNASKKYGLNPNVTYYEVSGPGLPYPRYISDSRDSETIAGIATGAYNEGVAVGIKIGMEVLAKHIQETTNAQKRSTRSAKRTVGSKRNSNAQKTGVSRG